MGDRKRFAVAGLVTLSAAVLLLAGCTVVRGTGRTATETRAVSGFDSVEMQGTGELLIGQGGTEGLAIETDEAYLRYITAEVRGRTLVLSTGRQGMPVAFMPPGKIVYRLQVKDLTSIKLSGSGKIRVVGLETDALDLDISGSGTTNVEGLKARKLRYALSGSGKATASGAADEVSAEISGSGSFEGADLKARAASARISGSGNATLWATDTLEVTVSGSGNVRYYGSPSVRQDVSGSGNVRALGAK